MHHDGKPHPEAVAAAMRVMDQHLRALNAGDEAALGASLHFPHYRLAGSRMTTWADGRAYLRDFHARAGDGWHHSAWDSRTVIAAGDDKVHLDVRFSRYREDGSLLGRYRSLWVVTRIGGRWAAQLRSTFAP